MCVNDRKSKDHSVMLQLFDCTIKTNSTSNGSATYYGSPECNDK